MKYLLKLLLCILGVMVAVFLLMILPVLVALLSQMLVDNPNLDWNMAEFVYSWPVAATAMVVFFIVVFREPLSAKLADLLKVQWLGGKAEFQPPPEKQEVPQPTKEALTTGWETLEYERVAEKTAPVEMSIIRNAGAQPEAQRYFWFVLWHFERVWARIYKSQIELLQFLSLHPATLNDTHIMFYDRHKSRIISSPDSRLKSFLLSRTTDSETDYFRDYLGFLQAMDLISVENETVAITPIGKGFLGFLPVYRYSPEARIL